MIHIAVVEDEEIYAQKLSMYIRQFSQERGGDFKVTRFRDGDEIAVEYTGSFDIILMDIQMEFMNGMEAARRIRERDQNVIILFITNRTDYALQGYQVDALDYVIKPVTYFAFADRLERALERLKKRASRSLILSLPDGILRLQVADIFYIESDRHNLVYHTVNGEVTVRQKMQDAEESLTGAGFYRIHKGYLVNLAHVDGIRGGDCLIRGRALPVSRTRRNEFMKVLMNYLGE